LQIGLQVGFKEDRAGGGRLVAGGAAGLARPHAANRMYCVSVYKGTAKYYNK
jgi:hypothetical protein